MSITCFVSCATGLEKILASELKSLGIKDLKTRRAGVDCTSDVRQIYRICLWSRVANRVLFPLAAFKVADEKSFYDGIFKLDWSEHMSESGTLAVDFYTSDSCITHSQYGAQLTKDAVVDRFREKTGTRPNVDRATPDIRINVYLFKNRARVSLDLAGSSLHRRNYRVGGGLAPLKENLAATILMAAEWPKLAKRRRPLADPMCGSGTLLIEGAMMAAGIAPGTLRDYFGFTGWKQHQADIWEEAIADAKASVQLDKLPPIIGYDIDEKAVSTARANVRAAGLDGCIEIEQGDFFSQVTPLADGPGLVVINPPYGERLEKDSELGVFYSKLGRSLRRRASNWKLALLTGKPALFHRTGFSRRVLLDCVNGGIDCRLFVADIPPLAPGDDSPVAKQAPAPVEKFNPWLQSTPNVEPEDTETPLVDRTALHENAPGLDQFRDRLRKNLKQLSGWARSAGITNYRVYDADLPDYAFALDVYSVTSVEGTGGSTASGDLSGPYICLQEYKAPSHIDPALAQRRIDGACQVVVDVLGCAASNLAVKTRARQRAESQYVRLQKRDEYHEVAEGECRLLINIHDYLDTGLFLDHRKVRHWIGKTGKGKRVLNLYCYTGSATVHAITGGARETISVDLSQKYLDWAQRNFVLNRADLRKHQLLRADCRVWLEQFKQSKGDKFDMVFLDPPTFSNSTSMDEDWEVQRDHESMIDDCMSILVADGILIFSNNFRRFKLAPAVLEKYEVQDRSKWSLQRDYARNPRVHQCWFISQKSDVSD